MSLFCKLQTQKHILVVEEPAWVNCNPIPNPKNGAFYGQIEMGSFEKAAELIKVLREANSTISMADWAKEETLHRPKAMG